MIKIIVGIIAALGIIWVSSLVFVRSAPPISVPIGDTVSPTPSPTSPTPTPTSPTPTSVTPTPAPTPVSTVKTFTLAVVATHNNASSCWTAINGKVYDVTAWIPQHPGGQQAILGLCGKDGSSAFNNQHGGQRRPASELASFYIADLSK